MNFHQPCTKLFLNLNFKFRSFLEVSDTGLTSARLNFGRKLFIFRRESFTIADHTNSGFSNNVYRNGDNNVEINYPGEKPNPECYKLRHYVLPVFIALTIIGVTTVLIVKYFPDEPVSIFSPFKPPLPGIASLRLITDIIIYYWKSRRCLKEAV